MADAPDPGAAGETLRLEHPKRVRGLATLLALPALMILGVAPFGWLLDGSPLVWAAVTAFPAAIAMLCAAPAFASSLLASSYFGAGPVRFDGKLLSYDRGARLLASEIAMVWRQGARRVQVHAVDGRIFSMKLVHAEHADELALAIRRARSGSQAYPLPLNAVEARLVKDYLYWAVPAVLAFPFIAASPFLALPAAGASVAMGMLGRRRHPELLIGADGVRIRTRLTTRFVPYADVEHIELRRRWYGHRIILTLRHGKPVRLPRLSRARAELVEGLLREGVQMHETGMQAGATVTALEAVGDLSEWTRRAENAVAKGADYRVAAVEPEKLEWLMRNPAASPTQRVGAALAMRNAPAGRKQIRVAADVSSDPTVKEALSLLAEEEAELDSPALREVLARVRGKSGAA